MELTVIWFYGLASFLFGGVIGLISVAKFAVILLRIERKDPKGCIKCLGQLIFTILGGSFSDYLIFDKLMKVDDSLVFYVLGLTLIFLSFGLKVFSEWIGKNYGSK